MTQPIIYHGTPITPNAAFRAVMPGRAACISFYRPDQIDLAEELCPRRMIDNGKFSEWQEALKAGLEFDEKLQDNRPFYQFLETRLGPEGVWAVIPDVPGAPSQINDAMLNDWPYGPQLGAPLWHMNGPISRLLRLLETYPRVCLGWVGEFDPVKKCIRPEQRAVGCVAYRRRMDDVAAVLGNRWPNLHMMRGVAVVRDWPFTSADSTSLGQNSHRYRDPIAALLGDPYRGMNAYADRLENDPSPIRLPRSRDREDAARQRQASLL